ncbi:MAG: hypothetical protein ACYTGV_18535 [Planctomycetota bacterium]|jgi:hypothetical protein
MNARYITPREAAEGLYLDFEGFQDAPPALAGVLVGERFRQFTFDPMLRPAAEARGCVPSDWSEWVAWLDTKCTTEGRRLVGFTQHELNVLRDFGGLDVSSYYADGHKIARRWKNRCYPDEEIGGWDFQSFMEFIENLPPRHFRGRNAALRLRYVLDQLEKKREFDRITPVAKAKWTKLLHYNRFDCEGLRELVMLAAEELNNR